MSVKASGILDLELQVVISCLMMGLGTELRSFQPLTPVPSFLQSTSRWRNRVGALREVGLVGCIPWGMPLSLTLGGKGLQVRKFEVNLGYVGRASLQRGSGTKETGQLGRTDKDILVGRNLWAESGNMVCPRCPGSE